VTTLASPGKAQGGSSSGREHLGAMDPEKRLLGMLGSGALQPMLPPISTLSGNASLEPASLAHLAHRLAPKSGGHVAAEHLTRDLSPSAGPPVISEPAQKKQRGLVGAPLVIGQQAVSCVSPQVLANSGMAGSLNGVYHAQPAAHLQGLSAIVPAGPAVRRLFLRPLSLPSCSVFATAFRPVGARRVLLCTARSLSKLAHTQTRVQPQAIGMPAYQSQHIALGHQPDLLLQVPLSSLQVINSVGATARGTHRVLPVFHQYVTNTSAAPGARAPCFFACLSRCPIPPP